MASDVLQPQYKRLPYHFSPFWFGALAAAQSWYVGLTWWWVVLAFAAVFITTYCALGVALWLNASPQAVVWSRRLPLLLFSGALWLPLLMGMQTCNQFKCERLFGIGAAAWLSSSATVTEARGGVSKLQVSPVYGDTIRLSDGRTVRLVGFDAPETGSRARCDREREIGEKASAKMRQILSWGDLELQMVPCACSAGTEGTKACNYGRQCGVLKAWGVSAAEEMVKHGLARAYSCSITRCPPRPSWCS